MCVRAVEGRAVAYEPLASNFDWVKVRDELEELGESMNCDVDFEDVTSRQRLEAEQAV